MNGTATMEVKIPFLGDGIDSANVIAVLVKPGDKVTVEQTLVELETDKATAPVPSTAEGVVEAIHVKEGDVVRQGLLVVTLSGAGASHAAPESSPQPDFQTTIAPVHGQPTAVALPVPVQAASAQAASAPRTGYQFQSPTGAEVPTSPSIRKMAYDIGLDLTRIPGSGRGGRITIDDIRHFMGQLQAGAFSPAPGAPESASVATPVQPLPDFSKWGTVKEEKLSSLRQKIAAHLHNAWNTIPHVTQFDEVDITDLMALRKKHNPKFKKKKTNLTVTVFVLKALLKALQEFPAFNASYDACKHTLIYKEYYHIGVAVDTDNGLIVPVIRDVDQKSMMELSLELTELAEKARDRKLSLEEVQGGTATVSNLGGLGVGAFTPIVNHPEACIIGMGKGQFKPVYTDKGALEKRLIMPVAVSYDHRIIDGADGARFMRSFIDALCSFTDKDFK